MTQKTFIIAEIGINHNGDISIAKELIEKSKIYGVDAVKFQKRDINIVYTKEELDKGRESPFGTTNREQKLALEFEKKEYDEIDKFCKKIEIEWFASAWDINSLNFLKQYDLRINKIASAMIIDEEFLKEVAKEKKYTFISTGMSSYKEIDVAVKIFKEQNCDFELMHCVSQYPFDAGHASLNLINEMKLRYNCKVGYSGHEKSGLAVSYAAVALGATSLERHISIDRSMYGSDQAASLTTAAFSELVGGVRVIEKARQGMENKEILEIELPVAKKLRAHIIKK
jgi:N-acetylneuraminate synthase|tara:strand:- start:4294 stop:5145 length:852 start_codon:yes stop_codon:yes gene_type:complete